MSAPQALVTDRPPNANCAFFNDTGQNYDLTAAADAWPNMLDWYGRYVG